MIRSFFSRFVPKISTSEGTFSEDNSFISDELISQLENHSLHAQSQLQNEIQDNTENTPKIEEFSNHVPLVEMIENVPRFNGAPIIIKRDRMLELCSRSSKKSQHNLHLGIMRLNRKEASKNPIGLKKQFYEYDNRVMEHRNLIHENKDRRIEFRQFDRSYLKLNQNQSQIKNLRQVSIQRKI